MDNNLKNKKILKLLRFDNGVSDVNSPSADLNNSKRKIISELQEKDFGVDKVYFSGDFPTIYYKEIKDFDDETLISIREIHRKIWNQGKVAFLYIESDSEFRIYNCYYRPINPNDPNQSITNAEIYKINKENEKDLDELVRVFGKISIETGKFWEIEKYSIKLRQKRVNQVLIENLRLTRKKLKDEFGIKKEIVHDLLIRSLFILYLEDRGATDDKFYNEFSLGSKSYYDLLAKDLNGTYNLFKKLEDSFNGNLCPVTQEEQKKIKLEHLKLINECFWDKINFNGQEKLFEWKAFDFKYIPIELISEIYEEFLKEQEGVEKKSDDGAYYTPHSLVEFILNKVLVWPDKKNSNEDIRILDPTCGSGIFLVESFKRLVARWEFNHPGEQISFKDIKKIVKNNLHGIENNYEAIKVAAFSIYLAMLDKLEPKTLWKDKSFPYLIYDPANKNKDTQGYNLYFMSSLSDGPFTKINFDLIIGNPPFKEGKLDNETKNYNNQRGYPQEKVIAFIDRAMSLCSQGKIALLAASKPILFNTGNKYKKFRKVLFNECYVEEIYNFSILRNASKKFGGTLFSTAIGPASVLFFQKTLPKKPTDHILYCVPKFTLKNNLIDGVVIDQTDIKFLPREECKKEDSIIWKIAIWGTERDFNFINRLSNEKSIQDEFKEGNLTGWNKGVGFQISDPRNKHDEAIKKIPFIDASKLEKYYTAKENTKKINNVDFRRLGNKNAYRAPHLVVKEGLSKKEFCASFLDYDCSFKSTLFGFNCTSALDLKVLTAFLNSSFTSYFLFLTASSWSVERERVKPNEIFKLPASILNITHKTKQKIVDKIDEIIKIKKAYSLFKEEDLTRIAKEIDQIILKSLDFSDNEKIIIKDLLKYGYDMFHNSVKSKAYIKCSQFDIENYAETLRKETNSFLEYSNELFAKITIYNSNQNYPLNIIGIHFSSTKNTSKSIHKEITNYENLISEIELYSYKKFSESVYFRKTIRYYKNDTIYIIKANEKRFWTISSALNDADDIILEITKN